MNFETFATDYFLLSVGRYQEDFNKNKAQEGLRTPKRFAKQYWIFAKRFGVRKPSCALLEWDE